MTKYVVGGIGALLGVLGGLWLMLAPFALGYQPSGADWVDATKTDFWTGIGLILVSLIGLIMYILSLIGELRAHGIIEKRAKPKPQQMQSQERAGRPQGSQDNNIEQVLLPLVTAMLRDMQQQRGQSQSRAAEEEEGERP